MELVEIDLSKGDGHKHPDIKTDLTQYLAKIGKHFYAGTFSMQHYGLNFDGGPWGAGLQFDTPHTNLSDWKRLWEIVETEEEKAEKSLREVKKEENEIFWNSLTEEEEGLAEYLYSHDYTSYTIKERILKKREKNSEKSIISE